MQEKEPKLDMMNLIKKWLSNLDKDLLCKILTIKSVPFVALILKMNHCAQSKGKSMFSLKFERN